MDSTRKICIAALFVIITMMCLKVEANVCDKLCICDKTGFVNCSRNELTEIPNGIPLNTTNLDLSINNLSRIYASSFKHLINLTTISLAANNLGNDNIQPGAFNLPNLSNIDLSYTNMDSIPSIVLPKTLTSFYFIQNNLMSIAADAFTNTPSLGYLSLSNNKMTALPVGLFHSLPDLAEVDISFNQLINEGIPNDTFVANSKLITLSARFNQLEYILPNLPSSLQNIDYVGNNIKTIPSYAFKDQPNLQTIQLWNGQVTTLEEHAFSGLPKLEILDMMQDKVTSNITNTTFAGLSGLKTLYFDLNNVSYIDPFAFSTFANIGSLWLSGNNLSRMDPRVLDTKFMPHLSEVFIEFNPWYCDCHLKWLKEISEHPTFVIQDPHLVVCSGPPALKNKAWDTLKSEQFVC